MVRPALEVADIFRDHGPAWRDANRGHMSLGQLKVMSAIEDCRTAVLGGHVARCENAACGFTSISFNSCRNRHCPKCQGAQARDWSSDVCSSDLGPWSRKISATSRAGRTTGRRYTGGSPFGGERNGASRLSGLMTPRMTFVVTWV